MIINTNYEIFRSAVAPAQKKGININIIPTLSIYRLAQESSPNIVLSDIEPPAGEFPVVKFVGPKCNFPNYKYNFRFGFDHELLDTVNPSNMHIDAIFINKLGQQNKKFIKKMESLNINLKVVGMGFGISQLNIENLNSIKIASLYKKANMCAADNVEDILKIHYLNKICITPFNYDGCVNIFNSNVVLEKQDMREIAINNSWQNIFNEIFELTQEDIRWK